MWSDYLSMLLLTQNKILSIVLSLRFQLLPHFSWLPHLSPFSIAKYSAFSQNFPLLLLSLYIFPILAGSYPPSLTDQPSNQCFIAVKWFNHRPLCCKFFELAFLCLFFSHVNRLFCFMEIWYPPWQSLKNTYQALSAPCHWQIMRYQTLTRYIWGYFSYFTGSLCNDRRHFFLLIIIMLIQFVGLFFGNKMLATSLGQVVGKKITTTLYSSVVDSVGGGGVIKALRWRWGEGRSQKFSPGSATVVNLIGTDCAWNNLSQMSKQKKKKLQNKKAVKYERKGCAVFRGATPPPTY